MKLGIVYSAYTNPYGLEKGAEIMVEHGFSAVDYQPLAVTEKHPMILCEAEYKAHLKNIGQVFRASGVEVSQTHGPWRYPPRDFEEADRAERFDSFCKAVRGTAYLGCKYTVVHPIMPFGADSPDEPERFYEMNFDFYRRLVAYAKDYGVTVCLENMPFLNLPLSSPKSIAEFVREINEDNFKVCLDTGHANIFGMKLSQAVYDIGAELLKVTHIHDNNGIHDQHLNPFKGTTDWKDFGEALGKIGFDGTMSLETEASNGATPQETEKNQLALLSDLKKIFNYTKI